MNKEKLEKHIGDLLSEGPMKGTELVVEIVEQIHLNSRDDVEPNSRSNSTELHLDLDPVEFIKELVTREEILEVEYILPRMNYRVKSLYFPKGTIVRCPQ